MATTFAPVPSNPNWVREVTTSPKMREHLAGLKVDRLYDTLRGISLETGAFRTHRTLAELQLAGKEKGVYDTDSPEFRDAIDHYIFLYRLFHPVKAVSELPGILRRSQGN